MQILHVNKYFPPWIGGIETIVSEITEFLQDDTHVNHVLVCQGSHATTSTETIQGVNVIRVKTWGSLFSMPLSFEFFSRFKKEMQTTDVVLLHHPFPLGFLAAALFAKKKRIVVFYHADIVRQKWVATLLAPLFHLIFARASDIIVTSNRVKEFSPHLRAYQSKCKTIPLWIHETDFDLTSQNKQMADEIRTTYGQPLVLSVGRLVSYKGYDIFMDAMKDISVHALIIGTGPLKQELLEHIRKNNLASRITILDPVQNLAPYYYAATLFVLPSITHAEAFGIVQLEAMYCGCPVVNTALKTGVPEVSLDQITGLTVPPNDSAALAQAINTILSNQEMRAKFSERAHERVLKIFSQENARTKIRQIFS
ncbi:MAG: glycosyltransferase [Candidatus Uhrbacteria bacterium]|nr:glycosyltransferase [Candidatus Uhrbacteria bacterium]